MSQEVPDSREVAVIRRRMAQVRQGIDEDVQDIVEVARDMGKWRYYVRAYPSVFLGVALAGGYLMVPRRRVRLQPIVPWADESSRDRSSQGESSVTPTRSSPKAAPGIRAVLLSFVGNLVLRTALTHAVRQVDKLIAPQAKESPKENPFHERKYGSPR